jgi:hypothetical protein
MANTQFRKNNHYRCVGNTVLSSDALLQQQDHTLLASAVMESKNNLRVTTHTMQTSAMVCHASLFSDLNYTGTAFGGCEAATPDQIHCSHRSLDHIERLINAVY